VPNSIPSLRPLLRIAGLLLALAALAAAALPVTAQGDCHVSVSPTSGAVGTVFTVTGTGFGEPTILTVFRNGVELSETEVELSAETGAFSHEVTADAAGTWLARAILPESECGGEAEFTVLVNTSTDAGSPGSTFGVHHGVVLAAAFLGLFLGLRRLSPRAAR
jgi:hypothetical protein